jgi:hypothetical protein
MLEFRMVVEVNLIKMSQKVGQIVVISDFCTILKPTQMKDKNEIEFNFWGIRFNINNPKRNTLIALVLILVFILVIVWIKAF